MEEIREIRLFEMITKVKVLILDKSPLMRKLLFDTLSKDAGIEIVRMFKDYKDIKNFVYELSYIVDCIIVNILECEEDFINVLLELKKYGLNILCIINSEEQSIDNVKQILGFGNIKFISHGANLNFCDMNHVKDLIVDEVYNVKNSRIKRVLLNVQKAIVIASSTGGPKIIEYIFNKLKVKLDLPIFIVQHMPDGHTQQFVEHLSEISDYKFQEGRDNEIIRSNCVYIAPSGYHMLISNGKRISLNQDIEINNVRPSADILFESASRVYKNGLLGIILTGMGKDGSKGVGYIKDFGGITIAQNQRDSIVFGMPKSAIETGNIDKILSTDEIIFEIIKHAGKV